MQAAAAGAAAGAAPQAQQSLAQLLLGRQVVRSFVMQGGVQAFHGVITNTRLTAAHGQLWRVSYDDGDAEDLTWPEVRQHLVGGLPVLVG